VPEDNGVYRCSAEPPHRLRLESRTITPRGVVALLSDGDDPAAPPREVFVTNAELSMSSDEVYKACFRCVDLGRREKAFAIPKSDLE